MNLSKGWGSRIGSVHPYGYIIYITKSGDNSYRKGQRITITGSEILEYANIVEKIGNEIMQLTSKSIITK